MVDHGAQRVVAVARAGHHAGRPADGDQDQERRSPEHAPLHQPTDAARPLVEARRELHPQAVEPRAERLELVILVFEVLHAGSRQPALAHVVGQRDQALHLGVAGLPDLDGAGHLLDDARVGEQRDHGGRVVGVIERVLEGRRRHVRLGRVALQRLTRATVGQRDGHAALVRAPLVLVARADVALEVAHRVLLRLDVVALCGDVGLRGDHHLGAQADEDEQRTHHHHEHHGQQRQVPGGSRAGDEMLAPFLHEPSSNRRAAAFQRRTDGQWWHRAVAEHQPASGDGLPS